MKPLDKTIQKRGFTFVQKAASPKAYLYEQRCADSNVLIGYEVFEHRENKERTISGVAIGASVAWPYNEAFGDWAFCYRTLEKAQERFNQLNTKEKKQDVPERNTL